MIRKDTKEFWRDELDTQVRYAVREIIGMEENAINDGYGDKDLTVEKSADLVFDFLQDNYYEDENMNMLGKPFVLQFFSDDELREQILSELETVYGVKEGKIFE